MTTCQVCCQQAKVWFLTWIVFVKILYVLNMMRCFRHDQDATRCQIPTCKTYIFALIGFYVVVACVVDANESAFDMKWFAARCAADRKMLIWLKLLLYPYWTCRTWLWVFLRWIVMLPILLPRTWVYFWAKSFARWLLKLSNMTRVHWN